MTDRRYAKNILFTNLLVIILFVSNIMFVDNIADRNVRLKLVFLYTRVPISELYISLKMSTI